MNQTFSDEQIAWLRAGYRAWRIPELTQRFNARFGTSMTEMQIRACTRNRRMLSGRPAGVANGETYATWGPDKIDWLRQHRAGGPIGEITQRINAVFGWNATPAMVANACKRHGIVAGSSGRFAKRNRPWNKGLEGYTAGGRSLATRFARGNRPHTKLPAWSYKQEADWYWYLKVSDNQAPGRSRRNWMAVHRLTWEGIHGPIPPGHVVVLLDGNPDNCLDPGNLACLHRRVLLRLTALDWDALCPDVEARRAVVAMTRLQDAAQRTASDIGLSLHHSRALVPPIARFHHQPQDDQ